MTGTRTRSLTFLLTVLAAAIAALSFAGGALASVDEGTGTPAAPTISSDKADYAPGELVTLTGSNWAPGEEVVLDVNDDQGATWRRNATVTADADGRITDLFNLPDWFVATYAVTATGASSGTATTSFTDGQIRVRAGRTPDNANTAVTVAAGDLKLFSSNDCSGTATSSNGSSFTTDGGSGNGYESPSPQMNAPEDTSFSVRVPSSVTVGTTTYSFAVWQSDNENATLVSTTGTTGCFLSNTNGQISLTANYADTVNTTTTASPATATFGDTSVTLAATVSPATGSAPNVGTVTFTVKKGATTIGTATSGTVTGGAASASFSLAGVNADTYTIEAAYSGGTGFNTSNNSSQSPAPTLTVGKAASTTTVSCGAGPFTYNGSAHTPCSVSVTGAGGLNLTPDPTYSNNVNAGTATASYTYEESANHLGSSDSKNFTIGTRPVTASIVAANKVYDGTDDATISSCTLNAASNGSGVVSGDTVGCQASNGKFDNKNAGTSKPVSANVALTGADNYHLTSATAATNADITKADLDIYATSDTKVYDGTTSSSATPTVSGLQGSDTVTGLSQAFQSKNVLGLNGSTLAVTGYTLNDGNSGGNYDVTSHTASGTITKADLDIRAVTDTKVYDATTSSSGVPTVSLLKPSDTVTGKAQAFQSKDVLGTDGSTLEVTAYTVNDGNSGGNYNVTTHTAVGTITKKALTVTAQDKSMVLNGTVPPLTYVISGFAAAETLATSGVTGTASCTTADGTAVGSFPIVCAVGTLVAQNYGFPAANFVNGTLTVTFAMGDCLGSPGRSILQPINTDGTSVFKQGSTVPAKFRVCDAGGNSIGTAGVVSSFKLVKKVAGVVVEVVTEEVLSTTPDSAFRWSATDQQWIYNMSTKNLAKNTTYYYEITLADATKISFNFGLK